MAIIRSSTEIINSMLDFYRIAQPLLTTNPGSVSRDLLIDGPANQLSKLYDELNRISNLQSLRFALGSDLDALAKNYGAVRQTGSKASNVILLTFNSLDSDFSINSGELVFAKNGTAFVINNSLAISTISASNYKATAAKFKSDLEFLGITDQFAVEVLVTASASGRQGNVSKYAIIRSNLNGISHVTNISPIGGGSDGESDAAFRTRILSIFSGANTGTALGYANAVKADSGVIDAVVIQPGDPLMTRDGTQVTAPTDGSTPVIISEGSGGKIDILVFGNRLQEATDSFVYHDRSNTGSSINSANDFILGQISADSNKTVTQKRLANLENQILPNQPVNNIVNVTGSLSGPNFIEKSVDELGVVSGNFELIRDTGSFGGSPWGFDRLHWIDDHISNFPEDKTKSIFNGQDAVAYSDVAKISKITENKIVTNENGKVNSTNRSSIQLAHTPISNVTRVLNVNTGERYIVSSQNPDGTSSVNTTGRILISGKSLPAVSDLLQIDYTWIFSYDPYFDFDNKLTNQNSRTSGDTIDWGFSNLVRRETAVLNQTGSFLTATVTHPISSVIKVNTLTLESSSISFVSGRLSVIVATSVSNVVSILRSDGSEIWKTNESDGSFNARTIFLPSDTPGILGDSVEVTYNAIDVFNTSSPGSFNDKQINIVPGDSAIAGAIVEIDYLANVGTLLTGVVLSSLPLIRSSNSFKNSTNQIIGSQPTSHIFDSTGKIFSNLRQAPSQLGLTLTGNISPGTFNITGTTLALVVDAVYVVSSTGLVQDLSTAIKKYLKLTSKDTVPSNIKIGRVVSVEQVTTDNDLRVISSDHSFDLKGYGILDNSFVKNESVLNSTLSSTEFSLPLTAENNSHLPTIGHKIRISFYLVTSSDNELVSFTKPGTLYTNKKFGLVESLSISSGFTSGSSTTAILTVTNLNQPTIRTRYKTYYDYMAPKANERITLNFNFQKIISDTTLAIEGTRPINADVLVKLSTPILIDATLYVIVTPEFVNNSSIVLQNVQDAITTALNASKLATTIDSSDLTNVAYGINGVDRVRITYFNKTGIFGSKLTISAQKNQYLVANNVSVILESR